MALGALLIIWQAASVVVGREILIPSPKATFDEVLRIMGGPRFLTAVGNTLKRAVAGFSVALVAGLSLGLAAGFSKPVYLPGLSSPLCWQLSWSRACGCLKEKWDNMKSLPWRNNRRGRLSLCHFMFTSLITSWQLMHSVSTKSCSFFLRASTCALSAGATRVTSAVTMVFLAP